MTDAYLLFLNADFVLSDGSYEGLIPHMLDGRRVLLAPSYCTVAERVAPLLNARWNAQTQALAIPPRELTAMILAHRHNTIRAKTINQDLVHFEYMDQSYWEVDADTLLGHQMPISLVAMRPERALNDLSSFWDWGIVYDFCPSQQLTVLGDSDDFLMLELREEDTHLNLIRLGPTTPKECAGRMTGYITPYQIDAGWHRLTLHSRTLPKSTAAAHERLQAFVDEQSRYLSLTPKDHRDHPDWIYHKEHLQKYHAEKVTTTQLAPERQSEPAAIEATQSAEDAVVRPELVLHPLSSGAADVANGWARRQLRRLSPPTAPWHPMYLAYRGVKRALRDIGLGKAGNILFVGDLGSPLARVIAGRPGTHFATSPSSARDANWDGALSCLPEFTTAVIELSRADLPHARKLYETAAERLVGDARIMFSWINTADAVDAGLEQELVALVLLPGRVVQTNFVSSAAAERAIRWVRATSAGGDSQGSIARAGTLLVAAGEALRATITHRFTRRGSVPSRTSLSVTLVVGREAFLQTTFSPSMTTESVETLREAASA